MAGEVFRRLWETPQKRRFTPQFTPQVFASRAWPSARTAQRMAALYAYQPVWKPPQPRHFAPLVIAVVVRPWPSARIAERAAAYGAFLPKPNPLLSYRFRDVQPSAARAWPSARIAARTAAAFEAFRPAHFTRLSVKSRDSFRPPAGTAWPSARIAQRVSLTYPVFRPPHFDRLSWRTQFSINPPAARAWPSRRIAERYASLARPWDQPAHRRPYSLVVVVAAPYNRPPARYAQQVALWRPDPYLVRHREYSKGRFVRGPITVTPVTHGTLGVNAAGAPPTVTVSPTTHPSLTVTAAPAASAITVTPAGPRRVLDVD
jgi:hypothetical protein